MCWPIDPSVPQDFSQPMTWHTYFLSISLAHLLTLFFFSSLSSLEISSKEAIISASSFFSSRDLLSCVPRRLLSKQRRLISVIQKVTADSMLPSKLLICTKSKLGSSLSRSGGSSWIDPGIIMTVFFVPYFADALLIYFNIRTPSHRLFKSLIG